MTPHGNDLQCPHCGTFLAHVPMGNRCCDGAARGILNPSSPSICENCVAIAFKFADARLVASKLAIALKPFQRLRGRAVVTTRDVQRARDALYEYEKLKKGELGQ